VYDFIHFFATRRDEVRLREALAEVGLEAVTQVAIDDVWSALRAKVVD